jgi:NADPH:quinone reductase-like Zn-dependent oxidoreductase
MRAAVYERYGPPEVVHLTEVPTPVPKDNEVLVRVKATTVTSADWRVRSLDLPAGFRPMGRLMIGIFGPRQPILGTELAGVVEAVGSRVTRFRRGDPVFAFPGLGMGCHVEYRAIPEDGRIAHKPANLTFEEAAALCFGGMTALDFFRRGKLARGESVLVNGAAGGVGSAVVQLARQFGASTITGVASTGNLDLVRSLGADRVIDYTRADFTKDRARYDVIVDTAGTAPYARVKGSLREGGRLLAVLGTFGDTLRGMISGGGKIVAGTGPARTEDVRLLGELASAGIYKPVIDSVFPFEEIVAAHARVDTGHKRGSVVVRVG